LIIQARGTVRNIERASWLLPLFNGKYGVNSLELVEVEDMAIDGAFDEAVKGCDGFIHTATPVMSINDPNVAIPMVIAGATNALKAAAAAGIKRVVLTSSSTAAASPQPNKVFNIDPTVWNEDAVKAAWAPPPYDGVERKLNVYSASKTQAEQAAWDFVKSPNANGITLNCVLPNMNMGEILSIEHQGYPSTMGWIKALWDGFCGEGQSELKDMPAQYYINVDDNANVHVAALIYEDVKSERLFTFAKPYNWNTLLALLRRMYPEKSFVDDFEGLGEDKSIVANERAEALLKSISGHGWTSLEDSVRPLTDVLAKRKET
jgi:nucleoside-diphosphate-sugar epimerase